MGYRSNVAIAIHQKVKILAYVFNKPLPTVLKIADVTYHTKDTEYFIFESIKWYSDDPEIQEFNIFFEWVMSKEHFFTHPKTNAQENSRDFFAFLRVGEDPTHIESMGNIYRFGIETTQIITTPEYSFS